MSDVTAPTTTVMACSKTTRLFTLLTAKILRTVRIISTSVGAFATLLVCPYGAVTKFTLTSAKNKGGLAFATSGNTSFT